MNFLSSFLPAWRTGVLQNVNYGEWIGTMADEDQSFALQFLGRPFAGEEPAASWIHSEALSKVEMCICALGNTTWTQIKDPRLQNGLTNIHRTYLFILDTISVVSLQRSQKLRAKNHRGQNRREWRKKSRLLLNLPWGRSSNCRVWICQTIQVSK